MGSLTQGIYSLVRVLHCLCARRTSAFFSPNDIRAAAAHVLGCSMSVHSLAQSAPIAFFFVLLLQ